MQKNILLKIILVFLWGCMYLNSRAQTSGVFGISNEGPVWVVSKIDPVTGSTSTLNTLMIGVGSVGVGSIATDPYNQLFFFSNGKQVITFDINTGAFVDSFSIFPLAANEYFYQMRFNICDSTLYGLAAYKLAKLNRQTGELTIISSQSVGGPCISCGSTIDPYNGIYYFRGTNLVGVSLATGEILTNVSMSCPAGIFNHLEFNCADSMLYGLCASASAGTKQIATIDPLTGIATPVSNSDDLNNYLMKQIVEQTIDPNGGRFYYVSAPNTLVGVNVITGDTSNVHALATGQYFQYITYYPQCFCGVSVGIKESSAEKDFFILPNPVSDELRIQNSELKIKEIEIYNVLGKKIYSQQETSNVKQVTINVSELDAGIYLLKIGNVVRKFVKE